ncbi:hypothetical protein VCO01S_31650 [Vibrio comitans NBRC 102076]|uniref:Uncharacterized protein n=1 Tax=Vibrio comitans NBRC 102076 TaxID=1219078 RepID=A0A4Y3IS80_9VIBR|nr:hypothetical protein VCO01S_31650 [Vibrio comitans NBRC 102076]
MATKDSPIHIKNIGACFIERFQFTNKKPTNDKIMKAMDRENMPLNRITLEYQEFSFQLRENNRKAHIVPTNPGSSNTEEKR